MLWLLILAAGTGHVYPKSINQNIIQDNSHWLELANFTVDNSDINVSKFQSKLTGTFILDINLLLQLLFRFDSCCSQG